MSTVSPTPPDRRILALDVLRGFALLGILIMNVQSFAMPGAAYFNPTAYGDLNGANRWAWTLSHLFADQKFMTLFSLLFGAGIVLFTTRLEEKGQPVLRTHYRRTFWLLLFGLVHAYFFWVGDILVAYALCSFVVVFFRRLSPRLLLLVGLITFLVPALLAGGMGLSMAYLPAEVLQQLRADWLPSAGIVAEEVAAYRGGWLEQMRVRVPEALAMQTMAFLFWSSWRAGGLMLVGMALFKWGVLSAERSRRFYVVLTAVGLGLGLPIVAYGVYQNFAHGWTLEYSRWGAGYQFNYLASLLVSLGYIGVIMLWVQWGGLPRFEHALGAVGRTALSNYFLQTLIATTLFYGHGFALFGSVERLGQIGIVLAIWTVQLIWSPLWLRRFRYGPAEWLWRSLTYGRRQPNKAPDPAAAPAG